MSVLPPLPWLKFLHFKALLDSVLDSGSCGWRGYWWSDLLQINNSLNLNLKLI
jgi:hypothetical protein